MNPENIECKERLTGLNRPPRDLLSLAETVVLADVPEKRVRKDIERGILSPVTRLGDSRICFHWNYVIYFAAVYGNHLLPSGLRKVALNKMASIVWHCPTDENAEFGRARTLVETVQEYIDPAEGPEGRPEALTRTYALTTALCLTPANANRLIFPVLELDCSTTLPIDKFLDIPLGKVCASVRPRLDLYVEGLKRVEEKDDVLGGEAVFKGTRLPVRHIGAMIENGESIENILEDYPYLSSQDLQFASLYFKAHPLVGRPRKSGEAENAAPDVG